MYEVDSSGGVQLKEAPSSMRAMKKSSIERHLYRINLDGSELQRLSIKDGVHKVSFSPDGQFYLDTYSDIKTLPSLKLYNKKGEQSSPFKHPIS